MAVGHTILGIIFALLRSDRPFADLGATYFDRHDAERVSRRLTRRLEQLGYRVTLAPPAAFSFPATGNEWSRLRDSNPGPVVYETTALPLS